MQPTREEASRAHWRANRRAMAALLVLWFTVSYLLGIVFVEPLNQYRLGGFPLGFWFAQQGSIYVFIVLIAVYAIWMDRIDRRFAPSPPQAPGGRAQRAAGERSSERMDRIDRRYQREPERGEDPP